MSRNMIPVVLGLTMFPLVAIGIAAYLFAQGGPEMAPVAVAVLVLAVCVLATALFAMIKFSRHEQWLLAQEEEAAERRGQAEDLSSRLATVEWHVAQPQERIEAVAADVAELRREVRGLAEAHARRAQASAAAGVSPDVPEMAAGEEGGADQLELLLEPVVELSTGSTLHYRALPDLADEHGKGVGPGELVRKADSGGMRPALDAHLMQMVAPVLRRLRMKNPGLRIFVPIGLATLSSREEAGNIISLLQRDIDVAGGMVFEFAQHDLAELDSGGIENLARLGRLGATLALSGVYLGGLDLTALRQLGVRFLSFPPHAADAGSGPAPGWRDFVQQARTMQVQIIISGIKTPQQATAASRYARFGHGPFFAPPRKVRPDAGVPAGASQRSASVA